MDMTRMLNSLTGLWIFDIVLAIPNLPSVERSNVLGTRLGMLWRLSVDGRKHLCER